MKQSPPQAKGCTYATLSKYDITFHTFIMHP